MIRSLLKSMRQSKELTQEELGEGICSRTTIAAYEKGKCEPKKLYMDALMQRLGKTVDKYYIRLDDIEYAQAKQRTWIQVCLRRGKLAMAKQAIQEYRNMQGTKGRLHDQFVAFVQAELLRRQKAPLEKQKKNILFGLSKTIVKETLAPGLLKRRVFHLLEFFLLQRYAILLEELGDEEMAAVWYETMLHRFEREERGIADKQKLYPLIAYRLANLRVRQGRFSDALPPLLRALELLRYSGIQNALYIMIRELEFHAREAVGNSVAEQERKDLDCIKEILHEDGIYLSENYYPTYLELYICSVNKMLLERRTALGRTRENLVGIICDTRTLERQEKNGSKPQKKTWKALFEELGLSYLKYDGSIVTKEYRDYQKFEEMLQAYDGGDEEKARKLYRELTMKLSMQELTNRQFQKYWDAELKYMAKEINREKRNEELWELLGWTIPKDRREKGFSCWLTTYERWALELLAWECEGEDIDTLLPLLKLQLYRNFNPAEQVISVDFHGKLFYCIARGYLRSGNLRHAERYITLAMKQRLFQDWGLSWSRILFLKFQVQEKKLGLQEKRNPPESNGAAFRWAELAWASAREENDVAVCKFMEGYFKRHYFYGRDDEISR